MFGKLITNKYSLALVVLLITFNSDTSVAAATCDDLPPSSTPPTEATCPCQAFYTLDSAIPGEVSPFKRESWCRDDQDDLPFGIYESDDPINDTLSGYFFIVEDDQKCIDSINFKKEVLTNAEAKVCKDLLSDTCQKKATCPCRFSNLSRDLSAPQVTIDRNRSCNSDSDDAFGVYATTTSPGVPPLTYTVGGGACLEIDGLSIVNDFEAQACKDDLQEVCDNFPPPSTPPTSANPIRKPNAKSSKDPSGMTIGKASGKSSKVPSGKPSGKSSGSKWKTKWKIFQEKVF